jgi:hypothetical protein
LIYQYRIAKIDSQIISWFFAIFSYHLNIHQIKTISLFTEVYAKLFLVEWSGQVPNQ